MKIELSDEAIEDIVCATLSEHMKYMKKNIKELKKKGKLEPFQQQDLGHDVAMLAAMEEVYGYFGGNL
jgi:hypothetical protein